MRGMTESLSIISEGPINQDLRTEGKSSCFPLRCCCALSRRDPHAGLRRYHPASAWNVAGNSTTEPIRVYRFGEYGSATRGIVKHRTYRDGAAGTAGAGRPKGHHSLHKTATQRAIKPRDIKRARIHDRNWPGKHPVKHNDKPLRGALPVDIAAT
jgi:hypothetical protein